VVETNLFSWLTLGSSPSMMGQPEPRISPVDGVDDVGNDFMRAVYNLSVDEVGVAMNYPQTDAYVIRLIEGVPDSVLQAQFLAAAATNYQSFNYGARIDYQPIYTAWQKSLDEEGGVDWLREPDAVAQR
jgi:hypothetical protein